MNIFKGICVLFLEIMMITKPPLKIAGSWH